MGANAHHADADRERRKVIFGSALGSAFEWYEFQLYGTLAGVIAAQFFSGVNETAGFIFALLTFGIGFAARPFGSLVFGRLGDLVGRKYTFLMTMTTMALPTFLVGVLPGYATLGIAAPIILIILRVIQGLSLGGEFGGAMVYVAEHSATGRRGRDTSWVSAMGAVGVIMAIAVQLAVRHIVGNEAFLEWGWRIPFMLSIVLFAVSLWVRLSLHESPVFAEMKASGGTSKRPIRDTFGNPRTLWTGLLLILGATAGLGAIAYTAMFYSQFFLLKTLKIDTLTVSYLMIAGLFVSIPAYPFFGWLSDRLGRKKVLISGFVVAAITMNVSFHLMTENGNPALETAMAQTPVTVHANQSECSLQFNPTNAATFTTSCDIAKSALAGQMISYQNASDVTQGEVAYIEIGESRIQSFNGTGLSKQEMQKKQKEFEGTLAAALTSHKYPRTAEAQSVNLFALFALVSWLLILYAWIFGSIPAMMCEIFPAKIRYTAMSLPYNLGTGIFGGFMPATAFAMVAAKGDIYFGLWYSIVILGASAVLAWIFLPETGHMEVTAAADAHAHGGVRSTNGA